MTGKTAGFDVRQKDGVSVLAPTGDWTVWTIGAVNQDWRRALADAGDGSDLDLSGLDRVDVAGAYLIDRAGGAGAPSGAYPRIGRLLEAARTAQSQPIAPAPPHQPGLVFIERVGRWSASVSGEVVATLSFLGLSLIMLARAFRHPRRIRWASVVHVMETAGFNAIGIVAMLAFFVGVALAYLGSQALADLGAVLLTVEMTSASMLRAFGAIIAGVLLAGRTTSAFTAEIGAMKMRQEIDALRVLGLDPFEVLVTPRLIAMVIITPILTFVAQVAGIFGGLIVCWLYLHISPAFYIDHTHALKASYFWGGIVKGPLFGLALAMVGCRHGLATGGDVASLGARVTTAVVQGIFLIILLNVVLEYWFVGMDW